MKRVILVMACVLATMNLSAQQLDTLHMMEWDPTYYPIGNEWVSMFANFNVSGGDAMNGDILARKYTTKQPLKIIGLAGVFDIASPNEGYPLDTTLEAREPEYLQLYHPLPDTMLLLKEASWSNVQPRYLMEYYDYRNYRIEYANMYEVYFDEPVEVVDSFYVATTKYNDFEVEWVDEAGHHMGRRARLYTKVFGASWIYKNGPDTTVLRGQYYRYRYTKPFWNDTDWRYHDTLWKYDINSPNYFYLMGFPIFDTAGVSFDDDTVGMQEVVDDYTTLMPNPARERAVLYSSFRIREVVVYDEQGRKVEARKVDDTMVQLDVAGYPKGMYLVVVTTTAGRTTKKLIVE